MPNIHMNPMALETSTCFVIIQTLQTKLAAKQDCEAKTIKPSSYPKFNNQGTHLESALQIGCPNRDPQPVRSIAAAT